MGSIDGDISNDLDGPPTRFSRSQQPARIVRSSLTFAWW